MQEMDTHSNLEALNIIAFTHRNLSVNEIGLLHIEPENQKERLQLLKRSVGLEELMYLTTCNRIEFTVKTSEEVDASFIGELLQKLYPELNADQRNRFSLNAEIHRGLLAVRHQLSVASSVDSMIVGEREIITQVRNAFDFSRKNDLTGDLIRLMMRHTIETAKRVYTETSIAKRPVSVVSLAYHQLRDMDMPLDARILIVGAGVTNTNMSRFLKKHGFTQFHVFNRTLSKAETLANDLNGEAHPLGDLNAFFGFLLVLQ